MSDAQAITALSVQAGRQAYLQTRSTAQDMLDKDKVFGRHGYEDSGLDMAYKQTHEAIGATRGIRYAKKLHGAKGFEDTAQSGVESQVESGLGAIRGARGIHALATQSGVKAHSDSNALRASIEQADGARGYIALNEFGARKSITSQQADRSAFNAEFGNSNFAAFKNAATSTGIKSYAEMKGAAHSVDDLGGQVFEDNAYALTQAGALSTRTKIGESRGGIGGFVNAAITEANAQQAASIAAISAVGAFNYVSNAAYQAEQKSLKSQKDREQDIENKLAEKGSMGLTSVSDLGKKGIENSAVADSVLRSKNASLRGKVASNFENGNFQDRGAKAATMEAYGITESDIADNGKNMSAKALSKFLFNAEKKIEKMEMSVLDGHGNIATANMRNMAQRNDDGTITWQSSAESLSSFSSIKTGNERNDNTLNTVGASVKNGIASVAGAFGLSTGEFIFAGGGSLLAAARWYDSNKKEFAPVGAKAEMKNGKMATMGNDGHWYDEAGNKADGSLKSTPKKVWDKTFSKLFGFDHSADNKGVRDSMSNAMNDTSNIATNSSHSHKQNSTSDHSDNKSKHSNSFHDNGHYNTPAQSMQEQKIDNLRNAAETPKQIKNAENAISRYNNTAAINNASNFSQLANIEKGMGIEAQSPTAMKKMLVAAETGGSVKAKAITMAATAFGAMGLQEFLAPKAQASERGSNQAPQKEESTLDGTANSLGTASIATSVGGLVSKTAAKVAPGVGVAYGAVDAVNREMKGDHLGAAMSVGIAASSSVPFVGTALSLAGTLAQVATDSVGITGGTKKETTAPATHNQTAPHGSTAASVPQNGHGQTTPQTTAQHGTPSSMVSASTVPATNNSPLAQSVIAAQAHHAQTPQNQLSPLTSGQTSSTTQHDPKHSSLFDNFTDSMQRFIERISGMEFKAHREANPVHTGGIPSSIPQQSYIVPDMNDVRKDMYAAYMREENFARSHNPRQQIFDSMEVLRNSGHVMAPPKEGVSGSLSSLTTALSFRQAAVQDRQANDTRESMLLNSQMAMDIWQLGKSFRTVHREQLEKAKREEQQG